MLDAVHDCESLYIVDLVDDAIVAAAGDAKAFELADEWLAEPLRVLGERAGDRRCDGGSYLLGKPVERARAFGCDLELIHPVDLREIVQWK